MVKKVIGIGLAFMMLSGMMAIGTWAYFSDFETASGNVMAAGILLLKTNDTDGVSQTLFATDLRPGSIVGPETIYLKNAGTIDETFVEFVFSCTEADAERNPVDKTTDETAGQIEVTTLSYNGTSILTDITDANGNGYPDVYDLANDTLDGYPGIVADDVNEFTIAIKLREGTPGTFQGDGIEITMTFILTQ